MITMLAHQGGWDEALFVALPMLGVVGLLWLARRRADRIALQRGVDADTQPGATDHVTDG
jgi:hypothetical protein